MLGGISQVGCARLCGVPETTMRRVINSLTVRKNDGVKSLEHLYGADLYLAMSSDQQAKILDSKVVASLVTYYAFDKNNVVQINPH